MSTGTTPRQTRELVPRGFYIDGERMTVAEGNAAVIGLAVEWVDYGPGEDIAGIVAAIRALDTANDTDASDYFAELLGEIATDAVDAINEGDALEPVTAA